MVNALRATNISCGHGGLERRLETSVFNTVIKFSTVDAGFTLHLLRSVRVKNARSLKGMPTNADLSLDGVIELAWSAECCV